MQNFVFYNPTKILFGRDKLALIGQETKVFGNKVLLVYGCNSLKKFGTYDTISSSLTTAGLDVVEFDGIQANPLLSKVREGIQLAKKEKIDVVIGAGGGSVIDTAKAIAAGALVEHDVWKFFTGKKGVKSSLPVTTVLTIPGSGSEMNNGMVLTNDETKQKFGFGHRYLFPKTSILNPELTFSINKQYTAYGAVDAICHILEFYLTHQENGAQVQKILMEGLIRSIMTACIKCIEKPNDYNCRSDLMWATTLSLNGLTASGLGKVGFPMHLLEHSISGKYNTPHGAGLAALLPNWLKYYSKNNPERVESLAKGIFPEQLSSSESKLKITEYFVEHFYKWMNNVGLPTSLTEMGIQEDEFESITEHTLALAKIWRLREYSPTMLESILRNC